MTRVSEQARASKALDQRAALFRPAVVLSKAEVFSACQALADADRVLQRSGGHGEAAALGDLFELLEQRLATTAGGGDR